MYYTLLISAMELVSLCALKGPRTKTSTGYSCRPCPNSLLSEKMSSLNPNGKTKACEKMYSLVLSYIICIMQAMGQNKFVCLMSY